MVRVSDLRMRDVVNVSDGRRLGIIKDFELDLEEGCIKGIVLPGATKILGFLNRSDDVEVPWNRIVKVGVDVILIDLPSFAEVHPNRQQEIFTETSQHKHKNRDNSHSGIYIEDEDFRY